MTTTTEWDRGLALEEIVRRSPLAVGLVDLTRYEVVAGSPSAAVVLGRDDVDGLDILNALVDSDGARSAVGMLRSGTVDAYEAQRVFVGTGGEEHTVIVWMRSLEKHGFTNWALALIAAKDDLHRPWEGSTNCFDEALPIIVGSGDINGGVHLLSSQIEELLGVTSSSFCAEPLQSWIHPSDAELFESALQRSMATGGPEVISTRLRTGDGGWALVRIVVKVGAVTMGSRLGVAILSDTDRDNGGATDASITGLAGEIRALDLVDAMTYLPTGAVVRDPSVKLTEREWEIVARLLRGDRVPTIAEALYLAPSTVRNHLVAVFRKVGVNSQQQLISHFRGKPGESSR